MPVQKISSLKFAGTGKVWCFFMKILIAEDDFASRKFMLRFLQKFGECDITVDGLEAVDKWEFRYRKSMPDMPTCS